MNAKTVKMLKRYADESSQGYNDLKRAWIAMNHIERTKARQEMERALAAPRAAEAKAATKAEPAAAPAK